MREDLAIDVRGLTRRFGNFVAVNDLSFSVKPGEVCWVLYGFLAQSALLFALLCVVPAAKGYAERRLRVRVV